MLTSRAQKREIDTSQRSPRLITLDDYRLRQEQIGSRVAAMTLARARQLVGQEVTNQDIINLGASIYASVLADRSKAAALGQAYYMSERLYFLGEELARSAPVEPYELNDLLSGMAWFMRPGERFHSDVEVAATAARHVKAASRRRVSGLSLVDDQGLGWARTSVGTTTCSFCLMLISRGPVYRSRKTAGAMKQFHNKCDCVVVPVFDVNSFPGRDEWLAAEKLWADSTAGKSGKDALAAFRKRVSSSAPGGQDATTV